MPDTREYHGQSESAIIKLLLDAVADLMKDKLASAKGSAPSGGGKSGGYSSARFKILAKVIKKIKKEKSLLGKYIESRKILTDEIKWCAKRAWVSLKQSASGKLKSPRNHGLANLSTARWFLMLIIKNVIDEKDACSIRLSIPRPRRLALKIHKASGIGADYALAILEKIRFDAKVKDRTSALSGLLTELLWQGVPLKDALNMTPASFDPVNNIVFIKSGRAYNPVCVSADFWTRIYGLMKKAGSWSRASSARRLTAIGNFFPGRRAYALINKTLRAAAKSIDLDVAPGAVNQENFRHAGLAYKLTVENVPPAVLACSFGPEKPTNVVSPSNIYPGMKLDDFEAPKKRKRHGPAPSGSSMGGAAFYEGIAACRETLAFYASTGLKSETLARLQRTAGSGGCAAPLALWIISLISRRGRAKYSPATLIRYFEATQQIFAYCEANEIYLSEIDEDDVKEMVCPAESPGNNKEIMVNAHTFRNLRLAARKMFRYLKTMNYAVPEIEWGKLQSIVDRSPRVIYLPHGATVRRNIHYLSGRVSAAERAAALAGVLGYYLGLRKKEMLTLNINGIRIYAAGGGFIQVLGKGSKTRSIPVNLLPRDCLDLLLEARDRALAKKRDVLWPFFDCKNLVETLFDKYWRNAAPDGPHTLRHAFATRHLSSGKEPLRVAGWMGHESLRTLQNTYDQGLWRHSARALGDVSAMASAKPRLAANYGSCTEKSIFEIKKKYGDVCGYMRKKAEKKLSALPLSLRAKFLLSPQSRPPKPLPGPPRQKSASDRPCAAPSACFFTSEFYEDRVKIFLKKPHRRWSRRTRRRNEVILNKWRLAFERVLTEQERARPWFAACYINKVLPAIAANPSTRSQYLYVLKIFIKWLRKRKLVPDMKENCDPLPRA